MQNRQCDENKTSQPQTELLAPAGSLSAAYHAVQAGADAVYFGLKEFSARKGARNFTMEEVARLKGFADSQGKRIYAALNTVIREEELEAVASALYDLESLAIDGVIIQDLGVLYLLHRWFPRLSIHASTQMAVHNPEGVETLKSLGVKRIILARELSREEIKRIRTAHPDVELEVFIHGALCYSVSGLCLASGLLLGRSGNRGECAQICRSWFTMESHPVTASDLLDGKPLEGYFFSCKDLALGEEVLALRRMGIDAFKIEGRLKSPEWVAAVTAYYRRILDAHSPDSEGDLERACWIFSRSLTGGYVGSSAIGVSNLQRPTLDGEQRGDTASGFPGILDPQFPGHRGIPLGKVREVEGNYFLLKPRKGLSVRDGLQFFRPLSGIRMEAVPFGIEKIHPAIQKEGASKGATKRGKPILFCQAGQPVWIKAPEPPPKGSEIFLISTHADALPEAPGNLPRKRIPLEISVEVSPVTENLSQLIQGTLSKEALLTIIIDMVNTSTANSDTGNKPIRNTEGGTSTESAPDPPTSQRPSSSPETLLVWKGTIPVEEARSDLGVEEVLTKYLSPPRDSFFQVNRVSATLKIPALPRTKKGKMAPPEANLGMPASQATKIEIPPSVTKQEMTAGFGSGSSSPSIFIPPSKLKQIRRDVYQKAEEAWMRRKEAYIQGILQSLRDLTPTSHAQEGLKIQGPPSRDRLYPSPSGIPFVIDNDLSEGTLPLQPEPEALPSMFAEIARSEKARFLPLAPVVFTPEPYWAKIEGFIHSHLEKQPASIVYLGLNNIGHIAFARKFLTEERVRFFADYGLYIANQFALRVVRDLIPRLDFYFPWIEEGKHLEKPSHALASPSMDPCTAPAARTGDCQSIAADSWGNFKPPLFVGRACVYRSLPVHSTCSACPFPLLLRQGKRTFILKSAQVGGSCLNLLFEGP